MKDMYVFNTLGFVVDERDQCALDVVVDC